MSSVRTCVDGMHAYGCVHVFLRLQRLRCSVASEAGRLLCILFVRHAQVPADTVGGIVLRPCLVCTRRAKIKTGSITWKLVKQALADAAVVETQIDGRAGDGGPCCATVPLLGGWKIAAHEAQGSASSRILTFR